MATAPRTITASNSVFTLTIPGLYPTPIQLDGYAADSAFAVESVNSAEVHMGVDGQMSAGYVFNAIKMKINLEADSWSCDIFERWYDTQRASKEIMFADATIDIPATGKSYVCTKGVLSSFKPIPDAKKTLGAMEFEITWESITKNFF